MTVLVKRMGTHCRKGARSRIDFSKWGAVIVSFSTRSHLLATMTSPHPASHAFSAILRSWTAIRSVASIRRRQTSARSMARSVRMLQ